MLKPKDFEELYRGFQSAPATFDCGKKCAPYNNGTPFCCDTSEVVPIAYKEEWEYLEPRTKLWHEFRSRSNSELEMIEEVDEDENTFIECRGVKYCERENRSVSCRTFPYEPYFDAKKNFLGLIFNRVLEDRCYMVDRHHIVTKKFIREFIDFFEKLMVKLPTEKELYIEQSRLYRQKMSRKKQPVVVLTPKGPFRAAFRGGALLEPWTNPDPTEKSYHPDIFV